MDDRKYKEKKKQIQIALDIVHRKKRFLGVESFYAPQENFYLTEQIFRDIN